MAEWIFQILLIAAGLLVAAALLLSGVEGRQRGMRAAAALLLIFGAAGVAAYAARMSRMQRSMAELHETTPITQRERFVSSNACQACHPGNYATWHDSFHRTMTQLATPNAVQGNFDHQRISARGRTYLLDRNGDEFWVELADPDADADRIRQGDAAAEPPPPTVRRRVVMTTGSHHQQTYWVASRDAHRVLNLPLVWLIQDQRWAPREDVFLRPPDRGRDLDCWNENCVECHSTTPELVRKPELNSLFGQRAAELGISCEACHGPGEEHIRANSDPLRRFRNHFSAGSDPTIVNPARLPAAASAQVCGQCHGMNVFKNEALQAGSAFLAGDDLHQSRMILRRGEANVPEWERSEWPRLAAHLKRQHSLYLDSRFWRDGTTRVSGREHNALTQSHCFTGGNFSCLSCHSLHDYQDRDDQLARGMDSDRACVQCHAQIVENAAAHSHHAANSAGSRCYNCHMPHTTYGLLKMIRSHLIDSPNVVSNVESGRPNACNLCHIDQTLAWTAQRLSAWYGQTPPALTDEQREIAAGVLWLLRGDAGLRALAAWHFGWQSAQQACNAAMGGTTSGTEWMIPYLAHALNDPYSAVRYIAHRSLRGLRGFESFQYDFVGAPQVGSEATKRVITAWLGSGRRGPKASPQLLFDASGMFIGEKVAALSGQRDNSIVDLRE